MGDGGYSRKSLWGDHTNHYDAKGNKIGESRDSIWGSHTNTFDAAGNKIGESRDSIWGDHTNHYDSSGTKIGESRDSIWGSHTNHYDSSGTKIGESRDSIWGDHTNHSGDWHVGHHGGAASPDSPERFGSAGALAGGAPSGKLLEGPKSRWGLVALHLIMLLGGSAANLVVILALAILVGSWPNNLRNALTYQGMFGVGLAASWFVACLILIVVGQILFSRDGKRVLSWAYRGLIGGAVTLVVIGSLGWADGWGSVLPSTGMVVGYIAGALRDRADHR
ncbi:hypothetical protein ACPCG0_12665 [Propionibacteriaceae bacterium Y1923]|uniref:hypothetical protein n=1 Tax=Aestuariimicrobium sp. Y1814 TaxID=3418742 RepID=UPI003C241303